MAITAVIVAVGCGGDTDEESLASLWDGEWKFIVVEGTDLNAFANARNAMSDYKQSVEMRATFDSRNSRFELTSRVDVVSAIGPDGEESPVVDRYVVLRIGGAFAVRGAEYHLTANGDAFDVDVSKGFEDLGFTDSDAKAHVGNLFADGAEEVGTWKLDDDRLMLRPYGKGTSVLVRDHST